MCKRSNDRQSCRRAGYGAAGTVRKTISEVIATGSVFSFCGKFKALTSSSQSVELASGPQNFAPKLSSIGEHQAMQRAVDA
jgi:hypothetical protein